MGSDAPGAWRNRALAIGLAVALEVLLLLLLLTLGIVGDDREERPPEFARFEASDITNEPAAEPEQTAAAAEPDKAPEFARAEPDRQIPQLSPPQAAPTAPVPTPTKQPPALLSLDPKQMAAANIGKPTAKPKAQIGPAYGPPDTGTPGDSQRVSGTSPTGEPLYAAQWYREPTDAELAGYLSTANGPGYALISCKTVANFRVEQCVLETEFPRGSQIGRSVLAAAWQFRVRPPRIGGRAQIGSWVRIKIDYTITRR